MHHTLKISATLSLLGTLMACAPLPRAPLAAHQKSTLIAAAPVLPSSAPQAQTLYAQGRSLHSLGQLTQAAAQYESVLQIEPAHVGALNALGVIHAQAGRLDQATALLTRAALLAPDAAHLHNNLGYVLLLAQRPSEAALALTRAQQLNPGALQTQQNLLLLAQAKRKLVDSAVQIDTQASVPASVAHALQTASPAARLVAVAPQIYELQTTAPQQPEQLAQELRMLQSTPTLTGAALPISALPDMLRGARLEVTNGTGRHNLARRMAERLASAGVITKRLTNAQPYRQMKTEIQFRAGHEALAVALQKQLPMATTTRAAPQLHGSVQIRLVLGHDWTEHALADWLNDAQASAALLQLPLKVAGN